MAIGHSRCASWGLLPLEAAKRSHQPAWFRSQGAAGCRLVGGSRPTERERSSRKCDIFVRTVVVGVHHVAVCFQDKINVGLISALDRQQKRCVTSLILCLGIRTCSTAIEMSEANPAPGYPK